MARSRRRNKQAEDPGFDLVMACLYALRFIAWGVALLPIALTIIGGIWPSVLDEGGVISQSYDFILDLIYGPMRLPEERRAPGTVALQKLLWVVVPFALIGLVAASRAIGLRLSRQNRSPDKE